MSFVTVAGGTAFATLSGSSMGSTALLGSLMVPEMQKRGYKKHMAIGPILGTGGLAMLIPPSALAVLLGTLAELDIGALLIAGVLPGLMLAVFYVILILGMALIDPDAAPAYEVEGDLLGRKGKAVLRRYPAHGLDRDRGDPGDHVRHRDPVRERRLRVPGRGSAGSAVSLALTGTGWSNRSPAR